MKNMEKEKMFETTNENSAEMSTDELEQVKGGSSNSDITCPHGIRFADECHGHPGCKYYQASGGSAYCSLFDEPIH